MTYEASIEMSEESGLEQIDEDEWTDRNFGNSTANDVNTSDDSISDLESDDDDERGIKVIKLMILQGGFLTVPPNFQYQNEKPGAANQRLRSMNFLMYKRSLLVEQHFSF
jgi:hypothetical protein